VKFIRTTNFPFLVSVLYAFLGGIWILCSDKFTYYLTNDPTQLIFLQTYKGWIYVSVTAFLLYLLLNKGWKSLQFEIQSRREAEEELEQSLAHTQVGLRSTVKVIAETVEARDPYTAGHQRRVSELARSIAAEMNLPHNQIDGIRIAANIHDLGKISIPVEILSKPSQLSDVEFSLIKEHPLSGYNILKDIAFPWPIARVILEHHERMDGSGYPNGLKGDELLLESRILAVADVVEAMASYRPYRAALGIDLALEEIVNNRGVLYDSIVVDACLRLFNEKGYELQE